MRIFIRTWQGRTLLLVGLTVLLVGCGRTPTPLSPTGTPTAAALVAAASATPTPLPTLTPRPTATITPAPTAAASPTPLNTPTPTEIPTDTPTPAPSATPTPDFVATAIRDLRPGDENVKIAGQVVATASLSKGFKFTLDDGTGQVTLVMWHNLYDTCPDAPRLNLGASVRVIKGKVGEYEGQLQIEPAFGDNVRVVAAGRSAAPQPINGLGAFIGQTVTISGEIGNVAAAGQSAVTLSVFDESGAVTVFIWRTVLERIPNSNPALGTPGAKVRVVGVVQEYRGALEVVPTLPYDVEILP